MEKMKKIILLNYLLNNTIKDKNILDEIYYENNDLIIFTRKMYTPIKKYREINEKLFGIKIEITI
jgi:hypothetical protein